MNEIIRELFRQKRMILIAIACLCILDISLYVVMRVYVSPSLVTVQERWNELRQRAAATGKADVAVLYRKGEEDLKTLVARIPAKRQFPRVLGDVLDEASSSNGLHMGAISYQPKVIKDHNLLAYSISLTVNGSYASIKNFLADMQAKKDLLVIDGVSFANSDLYEESVAMDLHLTVYLREGEDS